MQSPAGRKWLHPLTLFPVATLVIALLIVAAVVPGPDGGGSLFVGLALGIIYACVSLLAFWTAMGGGHIAWRAPFALAGVLTVGLLAGAYIVRTNGTPPVVATCMAMLFIQWAALQAPYWLLKKMGGWRIAWAADRKCGAFDIREGQFSLYHIFLLTAGVAVLVGVARWLASVTNVLQRAADGDLSSSLQFFGLFLLFNLLLGSTLPWLPLMRRPSWRLLIAFAAFFVVFTSGEWLSQHFSEPKVLRSIEGWFFFLMNGVHTIILFGMLLAVRIQGWCWADDFHLHAGQAAPTTHATESPTQPQPQDSPPQDSQ